MNLHLNTFLSETLELVADRCIGIEVISSEDLLAEIDKVTTILRETISNYDMKTRRELNNMLLIGADAVSL